MNRLPYLTIGITILLGILVLVQPSVASSLNDSLDAQNAAFSGETGANFTITSDPRIVVARIFRDVFAVLGILFMMYAVWGGFQILISRGDESEVRSGKATIGTATIGVLIMLTSYGVTSLILNNLRDATEGQTETRIYREEGAGSDDPLGPPPDPERRFR